MICHCADGNLLNSLLVEEVKECPMNETLWTQKSNKICNSTQDTAYHCLPTDSLSGFVEGCLIAKIIQPGTDSGGFFLHIQRYYADSVHSDSIQLVLYQMFHIAKKHIHINTHILLYNYYFKYIRLLSIVGRHSNDCCVVRYFLIQ